jgi:hypothetical protein
MKVNVKVRLFFTIISIILINYSTQKINIKIINLNFLSVFYLLEWIRKLRCELAIISLKQSMHMPNLFVCRFIRGFAQFRDSQVDF